jgi:flagellar biosynthesis/type III secretory pathway M-ring protein FliF/YscJ
MKTKTIPAIIMLAAGLIACVSGIMSHMDIADFMKMLLAVLVAFYIIGCIVKLVFDKLTAPKQTGENGSAEGAEESENTDNDAAEEKKEETPEESAKDNK